LASEDAVFNQDIPTPLFQPGVEPAFVPAPIFHGRGSDVQESEAHESFDETGPETRVATAPQQPFAPQTFAPQPGVSQPEFIPGQQPIGQVTSAPAFPAAPIITPDQWRAQQAAMLAPSPELAQPQAATATMQKSWYDFRPTAQAQRFTNDVYPTSRPTWTGSQDQPQPLVPPASARPVTR
jgi:hypothetical protein